MCNTKVKKELELVPRQNVREELCKILQTVAGEVFNNDCRCECVCGSKGDAHVRLVDRKVLNYVSAAVHAAIDVHKIINKR